MNSRVRVVEINHQPVTRCFTDVAVTVVDTVQEGGEIALHHVVDGADRNSLGCNQCRQEQRRRFISSSTTSGHCVRFNRFRAATFLRGLMSIEQDGENTGKTSWTCLSDYASRQRRDASGPLACATSRPAGPCSFIHDHAGQRTNWARRSRSRLASLSLSCTARLCESTVSIWAKSSCLATGLVRKASAPAAGQH